jgi:hypothetical protein
MACVKSVRFSVLFNGKHLNSFKPTRGLRKGDPLSPYLFLFIAEGFSTLLNHHIATGAIEELKICRRGPGISHLLFADDCLLFFKGNSEQASKIKDILLSYEKSTGQLLNPTKSSILLGQHCSEEMSKNVAAILKVENTILDEKYLGLPIPEGRMKNDKFQSTKDRLMNKCSDWSEKYTSGAAKETLIKLVAQAIPSHAMSVFKFSASLCDELSQIIRNYWWGDDLDRRRVHWMSWESMCKPKGQGGIGFRDLRLFNQALLARQAWRLIEYPDSLCARLLKAKYYPSSNLIDTAFIQNTSPCWQGIIHGLELLKKGVIWRINDGTKVRIWRDNWLPRGNLKVIGKASKSRIRWVSDLIDPATKKWKEDLVRNVFYKPDADHILQILLTNTTGEDVLAWHYERNGIFLVRSAYKLALNSQHTHQDAGTSSKQAGERDMWNLIWKTNVPPKVKVFLAGSLLPTPLVSKPIDVEERWT